MWVSFDPRERSIRGLATVVDERGAMVGGASKSCKTCTTVAALISILFQLAGNDVQDWTVRRHWLQAKTKC